MSNEGVKSYDHIRKRGGAPRESEGRALLEAARRLSEAQQSPSDSNGLREAARLNWRLWTIFQAELSAPDCPMPVEIRTNMLNLCNFVDKRTVALLAETKPQMADVLININRQIAAGLLTKPEQAQAEGEGTGTGPAAAKPEGFSI
jgi:flagellar protein FlaF